MPLLAPDDDVTASYERALLVLRREKNRRGALPVSSRQKRRLMRPIQSYVRTLDRVRREPHLASWSYWWGLLSVRQRLVLVACGVAALLSLWGAIRVRAHPPSWDWVDSRGHSLAEQGYLLVALVLAGVAFRAGVMLGGGALLRHRIRAGLRLAARLESGGRPPRTEASDQPFVGPPALDLLTVASIIAGLLAAESGFAFAGAVIAVTPMAALIVALARRWRVRLALPETHRRALPLRIMAVAAAVAGLFIVLALTADSWPPGAALDSARLPLLLLPLAWAWYYGLCVSLAQERFRYRMGRSLSSDFMYIERVEWPLLYWSVVAILSITTLGVTAGVLVLQGW